MLTIDDNYSLVGSTNYKQQKYPSDIDLFEVINECCSKEDVINFFIRGLRKISKNFSDKKNRFYFEIKVGLDNRFDFIDPKGDSINLSIKGFTAGQLMKISTELFNSTAIDKQDYDKIIDILGNYNSGQYIKNSCDMEQLVSIYRKYYIMRWSAQEIEAGEKFLYDGDQVFSIQLKDAIDDVQKINFEGAAIINNNIVDISNFFIVGYHHYDNNTFFGINQNPLENSNVSQYVFNSLRQAIWNLSSSCVSKDIFKMIKRMFSLGKTIYQVSNNNKLKKLNQDMLEKIIPFLSSETSALNYIKNSISIIADLIDNKVMYFPYEIAINQVKNAKVNLGKNTLINNKSIKNEYNPLFDELIDLLKNKKLKDIDNVITEIMNKLIAIIQDHTSRYLKEVGLLPLPKWLNPNVPVDIVID
jgi:hypothetical protein